jgi:mono/diheme cytochrome c family protein
MSPIKEKGRRKKEETWRAGLLLFSLFFLPFLATAAGCRQDMHDAPRYDPLEKSTVLPKGSSAQPLVAGTVPRGMLREDVALYEGKAGAAPVDTFPFAITRADLDRGQERFNIYCSPCHGRTGEGNGMVVQRGYRQAASYHIERLRLMPVGYFYDVMTNGFGAMPDYRAQITPEDRWRIIAYIRALQLSHHATAADVPAAELERLKSGTPAPATAPVIHK